MIGDGNDEKGDGKVMTIKMMKNDDKMMTVNNDGQ